MSSWKQYGGINKSDKFNNLSAGTIIADNVLLRSNYSGRYIITGGMEVSNYVTVGQNLTVSEQIKGLRDLYISNNTYLNKNLYFGTITEITNDAHTFLAGTASGIGINTATPLTTFDITGSNIEILTVRSSATVNRNIIAQNKDKYGITVTADSDQSTYIQFFSDVSINTANINKPTAQIGSKINGILDISAALINLHSHVNISSNINTNSIPLYDEPITIYDASRSLFLYDTYANSTTNNGTALTLIATDNSANTFARLVNPNKMGLSIGGGALPTNTNKSMGMIGLTDISGQFAPIQTMVAGSGIIKYKSTLGINTFSPKTDQFVMDINGPTHIGNGEITVTTKPAFEILCMAFSKLDRNVGIAVGTPETITSPYKQFIYYTKNGGQTWTKSNITSASSDNNQFTETNYAFSTAIMYDASYGLIGTTGTYLFYTNNGGASWYQIAFGDGIRRNIQAIAVNGINSTDKRIYISGTQLGVNNVATPTLFFFDVSNTTLNGTPNPITISNINTPTTPLLNNITMCDGSNNYLYCIGDGIQKYTATGQAAYSVHRSDVSYNSIYTYDTNYAVVVGKNMISYTLDAGANWTDTIILNTNLKSIFIYDSNIAVAVGDNGTVLYTTNRSSTWQTIPADLIQSSGMGDRITGSANYLRGIHMPDINSIVIANTVQFYNKLTTNGKGILLSLFLPNWFNRANNKVIDISGNMVISGDINVNDSGKMISNNTTFSLFSENVKTMLFATDASTISIGNTYSDTTMNGNAWVTNISYLNGKQESFGPLTGALQVTNGGAFIKGNTWIGGNLYVCTDVSFNNRLFVGKDVSLNRQLFVLGDVSTNSRMMIAGDVSLNSRLFVQSDVSVNSRMFIGNDVSLNKQLFVLGDVSINSRLYIGNDVSLNQKLFVLGDVSTNSRMMIAGDVSFNSRLFVQSDVSVNSRMFIGNDVSFNKQLFVLGDVSINSRLTVGNDVSFNRQLFVLGDVSTNSRLIVGNDVSMNRQLFVLGDVSTNSRLMVGNDVSLNKQLFVLGDVSTNSRMYVGNDVSLNRQLTVLGDVSINSRLLVAGDVSFNSRLNVLSDVSLNSRMFVGNDVSLNRQLTVLGDVSINSRLLVAGDVSFNSRLNVVSDVSVNSRMFVGNDVSLNKQLFVLGDVSTNSRMYVGNDVSLNRQLTVLGDVSINSRLLVAGDVSFNSRLYVVSDVSANRRLFVGNDVSLNRQLFVLGDVSTNSRMYVGNDVSLNRQLTVLGDVSINSRLLVAGDVSFNSRLNVVSDVSLNSRMFVGNDVSLNRQLNVLGDVSINSRLLVTGDVSFNSRLNILSDVSLNSRMFVGNDVSFNRQLFVLGDVSTNSRMYIGNDVSLNRQLFVLGDVSINSRMYVGNDVSLNRKLTVLGDVSINSRMYVGNDVSLNRQLTVLGDVSINSRLLVAGDVSFNSRLNVLSDVSLNSRMFVANDVSLNRQLNVLGDVSINSRLLVAGDGSFNSRLFVLSDISANSRLFVGNDVSFNKQLYVAGDVTINNSSRLFVGGDVSMNSRVFIGNDVSLNRQLAIIGDVSANNRLFVGGDVSLNRQLNVLGDVSTNSRMYVGNDVSLNKQLFVSGDVSTNSRLFVGNDASFGANVYIQKDLTIYGRLAVQQYTNQSIINTTTTNYSLVVAEDLSLNGRLNISDDATLSKRLIMMGDVSANNRIFVAGDVSMNSRLFVNSDISANSNLVVGNSATINQNLRVKGNTNFDGTYVSITGQLILSGPITYGANQDMTAPQRLFVIDDASFAKTVYAGNDIIAGNRLLVGNDASFNKKVFVAGDISANSRMFVGSDVSLNRQLFVLGDVSINSRLSVAGDVSFNSRLNVLSDVSLNSRMFVGSDVSLNRQLFVLGDASINSRLSVGGDVSFNSRLNVVSDISANSRMFVGSDVSLNKQLFVLGDASINSRLSVGGDVSFNSRLNVWSDISANSRMFVGSDASFGQKLFVLGDASINSRLSVAGDVSFNSRLNVVSDISANSRMFVGSDVSLNKQLFVLGDVSINSRMFVGSDVSLNKQLFVLGDASINSRLSVAGDVSFNSRLNVLSDVSLNSRMFVANDVSLNKQLFVMGDVSINNRLFVGSDVSLNRQLSVIGDLSSNSRLFVGGDVSFNNRLYVNNKMTVQGDLYVAGTITSGTSTDINAPTRLFVIGDSSLNQKLFVAGDVSTNSRMFVGNDVSLNQKLFVAGDVSMNQRLFVGGDVSFNGNANISGNLILGGTNILTTLNSAITTLTANLSSATSTNDLWTLNNLVRAPPAITITDSTATTNTIYIRWTYPQTNLGGLNFSYYPAVTSFQFALSTNQATPALVTDKITTKAVETVINNTFVTDAFQVAQYTGKNLIYGIVLTSVTSSSNISGYTGAAGVYNVFFPQENPTTNGVSKPAYVMYYSNLSSITTQGPNNTITVWYGNNIVTDASQNKTSYQFPILVTAGPPSVVQTSGTADTYTYNASPDTGLTITIYYTAPQYTDSVNIASTASSISSYQITYQSTASTIRVTGASTATGTTYTALSQSLQTVTNGLNTSYTTSQTYPDCSYTFTIAAKNNSNTNYGSALTKTIFDGYIAPLYSGCTDQYPYNTLFTGLKSAKMVNGLYGTSKDNVVFSSMSFPLISEEFKSPIQTSNYRGTLGKNITNLLDISANLMRDGSVYDNSVILHYGGFNVDKPFDSTSANGKMKVVAGTIVDSWVNKAAQYQGFYTHVENQTVQLNKVDASTSPYTLNLYQTQKGLSSFQTTFSFYYDELTGSPGTPDVTASLNPSNTNQTVIAGIKLFYGAIDISVNTSVTNLGNIFYNKDQLINYSNNGLNVSETDLTKVTSTLNGTVLAASSSTAVTFSNSSLSYNSPDAYLAGSIPAVDVTAYNAMGNTTTGSSAPISQILYDSASYVALTSGSNSAWYSKDFKNYTINNAQMTTSPSPGFRVYSANTNVSGLVPDYLYNSTTSYYDVSYSNSWSLVTTSNPGGYNGTNELLFANGQFQTKSSTYNINYAALYSNATYNNTEDYTPIASETGYRYATFAWQVATNISSTVLGKLNIQLNNVSYNSNNSSLIYTDSTTTYPIRLYFRVEDNTNTTSRGSGGSGSLGSISTYWASANDNTGLAGELGASNYMTVPASYNPYYKPPTITNGTSPLLTVVLPFGISTSLECVTSGKTYIYVRIGLPISSGYRFDSINAYLSA